MSATDPFLILDSKDKGLSTDYVAVGTSDWFRNLKKETKTDDQTGKATGEKKKEKEKKREREKRKRKKKKKKLDVLSILGFLTLHPKSNRIDFF